MNAFSKHDLEKEGVVQAFLQLKPHDLGSPHRLQFLVLCLDAEASPGLDVRESNYCLAKGFFVDFPSLNLYNACDFYDY